MRIAVLMVAMAAAAACSGGSGATTSPPPPPPPPPAPPPPPPAPGTVLVRNDEFVPETITIDAGQTVTWIWQGQDHNVTSVLSPSFGPNSPTRSAPFQHGPLTFTTAGTYRYICTIHGAVSGSQTTGMRGTVVVR